MRDDKVIWVECLRRDVVEKGIELPKYRPMLPDASAADVRAWVKNAITLHRAYASGRQQPTIIHSFVVDVELETTWTKIIRGRWCLAAMSNIFRSLVRVWMIGSVGDCEAMNIFYFPGPIVDGVVDDGTEKVRIALTIATTYVEYCLISLHVTNTTYRDPYIEILTIEVNSSGPILRTVQRLEGARHAFLLKDSIIGYGSLYGDDTFPLISDWRTLATKRLLPSLYLDKTNSLLGDVHVRSKILRTGNILTSIIFRALAAP